MALYVKVLNSFYTHRKTMRLRAKLGDDAFWLPPRLWAYAAQNQPDGDFANYEAAEVAMLIGYSKDASLMLEALQQAGFLDGMTIHDWNEHNAYHAVFSDRAKIAAEARWKKEKNQKKKGEYKRRVREETSIASSMETVVAFAETLTLPKSDGEACWHKWQGNGWTNGGKPIKNWQSTMRSWKAAGYMPSQKNGQSNGNGTKPVRLKL